MDWKSARNALARIRKVLHLNEVPAFVRRVIVGVIGTTVLLLGVALLVLPGPAFIVIPLGLAILATEFIWAGRWLSKARALLEKAKKKTFGQKKPVPQP